MDKITAHTMWMADVCWAHHFSFQTTHLMIIMLCLIHGSDFLSSTLLALKAKRVLSFRQSETGFLVEPCRVKDCKIMLQYIAENNVTKQNKELPSIPLYTYYILPYPVTQRHLYPLTTFIILVNINNNYIHVNKKRLPYFTVQRKTFEICKRAQSKCSLIKLINV